MIPRSLIFAAITILAFPLLARAQNNFFNRGGVALYEPVVDVVNSGARLVATPTVSADRKYVTLSMQPELSQLVALQNFPVAMIATAGGNVGGVPGPVGAPAANGQPGPPPDTNGGQAPPVQQVVPGNNLIRPGMTLLAPLP
jgi:hypothetical protein